MSEKHSIAEARSNLPRLVREAESGKAVELTRRGEAVAVLIGRRQYERLIGRYRSFLDAYEDFTQDVDLVELGIDPDELFAGTRDQTRGRDVRL
ncbi:MAG: type II toxin-antitoxin system Phd/YefM family antitoxin [Sedimenticolaceae bacterium]